MSYITIDKTEGVNPHLCTCPRCGRDNNELLLIGARKTVRQCQCGKLLIGFGISEPCPSCHSHGPHAFHHTIVHGEKLPGGLCSECEKEVAEQKAVVESGGIYFRCKCGASGVIKANAPICGRVRAHMKIPTGPCGIKLDDCPSCRKET